MQRQISQTEIFKEIYKKKQFLWQLHFETHTYEVSLILKNKNKKKKKNREAK